MKSVNPADNEIFFEQSADTDAAVEKALTRATNAFQSWKIKRFADRAAVLNRAADILDKRRAELAALATREMGKRLAEAEAEVEKCAWVCRHYAEHAVHYLTDDERESDKSECYVRYLPLGPVLAVMPWNFPYWQVFRFAAPTLMAGNTGLLKHASNVPQCARAISEVFREAGADDGVFQTLLIGSDKVESLIKDKRIKAVSLTGSGPAGAAVAAQAGDQIKPSLMELGGSDPFIVMPSADLEQAVETGVKARMINNGQSCIAAKRFIIHEDIYDDYVKRYVDRVEALKIGDPMEPDTGMGPLSSKAILDELADQVKRAVDHGARILTGGEKTGSKGNYYRPTVLADIDPDNPAAEEEFFGPVALMFKAASAQEAVEIANRSPFGLASSVWTNEQSERDLFINEIEAGSTFINAMVASDPRLPFGGVKASGYGRELSREGILAFVNAKTIVLA